MDSYKLMSHKAPLLFVVGCVPRKPNITTLILRKSTFAGLFFFVVAWSQGVENITEPF